MREEEIVRIEMFLSRVNRVTCPFRHGQEIPNRDLVKISNEQIDMENWLKEKRLEISKE